MEALDGDLVSKDKEESPSLALPNSAEFSPDGIAAHMKDIELEYKESGGDIGSRRYKDKDYISYRENSDYVVTDDIDSTVDNDEFFGWRKQ